jgi:hypothetical protein
MMKKLIVSIVVMLLSISLTTAQEYFNDNSNFRQYGIPLSAYALHGEDYASVFSERDVVAGAEGSIDESATKPYRNMLRGHKRPVEEKTLTINDITKY